MKNPIPCSTCTFDVVVTFRTMEGSIAEQIYSYGILAAIAESSDL